MEGIEHNAQGRLGVSMLDTETGLALGWRQDERFAMCSTFKLLLAGWMLSLVDQGRENLNARVHYAPADVVEYSPVSALRAGTGGGLTVGELCSATVSLSDNTAANVLLERHGGPAALTRYLRALGDPITRLDRNEPTLNEAAIGDVRDTTTPRAKSWCWANHCLPRPARGCSVGSLKPAPATSACARGPRAGRWGTRQALPAAVVLPTMWPCFGRQAPAVTAGRFW